MKTLIIKGKVKWVSAEYGTDLVPIELEDGSKSYRQVHTNTIEKIIEHGDTWIIPVDKLSWMKRDSEGLYWICIDGETTIEVDEETFKEVKYAITTI